MTSKSVFKGSNNLVNVLIFSNTCRFLISNKMWVIKTGFHTLLVQIANRENPGQTASSEAV